MPHKGTPTFYELKDSDPLRTEVRVESYATKPTDWMQHEFLQ